MPYILEVQKYAEDDGYIHIGYLKKIFDEKNDACIYYKTNNNHMRSLNEYNSNCSDWDPKTGLRYVIRKYNNEMLTIDRFNPKDIDLFY